MLSATPFKLSLLTLLALGLVGSACTTGEVAAHSPPAVGDPNPNGKPPGDGCATGNDCRTGVCTGAICQASTNTDGVRNGDETDVDCGGASGPPCGLGKSCTTNESCASGLCADFKCADGGGSTPDCGGALPKCADGKPCGAGTDCESGVCEGGTCKAPGPNDGVKNGGETGVDCGGTHPDKCADGQGCLSGDDCKNLVCDDATKKCAAGATCTQLEGGQTCGPNDGQGKQADCCERAKVGNYTVDKYQITAGRMRAFLTRHNGKIRDWAATLPANKWNQAWTAQLPNSIDGTPGDGSNANTQLGPYYGKRSCETGYHTGHTFWTPPAYGDTKDFPQNVLDTKALNCVPWWLMAALCVFDGGHLLKEAELRAAYTNNGTTAYPWGARGTYTTTEQNDYAIGEYSYATPNPPPNAPRDGAGYLDVTFSIAPPGRRPMGYNTTGHADLVGNLLEWVSDSERQFVWKGSFERHAREADGYTPGTNDPYMAIRSGTTPWRWHELVAGAADSGNVNGYYGIGGRCGY